MKLTDADIAVVKNLLFERHLTCREVALFFDVDVTTARRWRRKYRVFGAPYTPRSVVQGRPKLLTDAQRDVSKTVPCLQSHS
jgi:transposase